MNAEEFFAAPEAREPSRPRAVNPLTGKEQSWTRASNYAASLDSPHGLVVWQLRELVRGLALRPDLARMILAGVPLDDAKSKVDEIIKGAHGTAGIDAKANDGTAIHSALSRSWVHGIASVPEEFHRYVHAFAAACKEYGLRPVATEQTVLNTRRGSRGTLDWVMQETDGAHVIVDVKSGRLDVAKRKFDVQCAIYDEADFVLHADGSATPIPWELRRPYAVLIHIDPETAAVSVYKLDLHLGRYGAELAEKVRQWHTLDPMTPYSPPLTPTRVQSRGQVDAAAIGHTVPQVATSIIESALKLGDAPPSVGEAYAQAELAVRPLCAHGYVLGQDSCPGCDADEDLRPDTNESGTQVPRHDHTKCGGMMAGCSLCEQNTGGEYDPPADEERSTPDVVNALDAQTFFDAVSSIAQAEGSDPLGSSTTPTVPSSASAPTASPSESAPEKPYDPDARFASLMKGFDKSELQVKLRARGWADLAHNRRWLARALVVLEQGWTDEKMIRKYAGAKDDEQPVKAAVTEHAKTAEQNDAVLPESRAATRREVALTAIAGASSVGALAAFHRDFVERHGDAAWTDELADAAKARTTELDGVDHAAILARIELCEEQAELAELWSEVTLGGTVKSLWTPFDTAAKARMGVIRDRVMAQKTDNPFG